MIGEKKNYRDFEELLFSNIEEFFYFIESSWFKINAVIE